MPTRSLSPIPKWKFSTPRVWHAPKRNSDYWLGNPLPHIPKITFKSIFRTFWPIHIMQRRHVLITEDVFFGIGLLTKTGQWIRRPDFYQFSLWFHLRLFKNNHTLPITNFIKQGIILQNIFSCNSLAWTYLFFYSKEKSPMCEGLALFGAY